MFVEKKRHKDELGLEKTNRKRAWDKEKKEIEII